MLARGEAVTAADIIPPRSEAEGWRERRDSAHRFATAYLAARWSSCLDCSHALTHLIVTIDGRQGAGLSDEGTFAHLEQTTPPCARERCPTAKERHEQSGTSA